jgi:hypothetical protein
MKTLLSIIVSAGILLSAQAQDTMMKPSIQTLRITITNTSETQVFSPPVVLNHKPSYLPFELGAPVANELIPLAEDGDAGELVTVAKVMQEDIFGFAVAGGPLPPGESVTLELQTDASYPYLSVFGMLVTTNDGVFFYGEDLGKDAMGDARAGEVLVLDAGSEANTELCDHIPGPPCGSAHQRVTAMAEGIVSEHPGILGTGDLSAESAGWSMPVATVTVEVL